jgi:hypothetical protein
MDSILIHIIIWTVVIVKTCRQFSWEVLTLKFVTKKEENNKVETTENLLLYFSTSNNRTSGGPR